MPTNRKFHTEVNNKDIIHQSEDGGGFKLSTEGKFIFGAKQQNVIDQLNEEKHTGNVDINANNQPFMAILNNNQSVDVNIGNINLNSLVEPTDNIVEMDHMLSSNEDMFLSKDNPVSSTPQEQNKPTEENSLPDDESKYNESKFYNSVGSGGDGTGYEGHLTQEQIQYILSI